MKLFNFGVGYSAEAYLRLYGERFTQVTGTSRTAEKARRLEARYPGLEMLVFDGTRTDPVIEERLLEADALLVSVAPGGIDPALALFGTVLSRSNIQRIAYLSTIGVYGVTDGGWVDESTAPASQAPRSLARVEAENGWMALGSGAGKRVFVLRLAGIYGPGRNAIENVRDGTARRITKPGQVFNRIHVDDIAGAIEACMTTVHPGGVFNVCDDEPAPLADVVSCAAGLLGVTPPPEIPFEQADLSPMAASFWVNNQRVSNRRSREELGLRLRYPTYREGLASLLKEQA